MSAPTPRARGGRAPRASRGSTRAAVRAGLRGTRGAAITATDGREGFLQKLRDGKAAQASINAPPAARGQTATRRAAPTSRASTRGRGHGHQQSQPPPNPPAQNASRSSSMVVPEPSSYQEAVGNATTRYNQLKDKRESERVKAIKDGFLADPEKKTTLDKAITPVGTCEAMCPDFERVERIVQNMVDKSEKTYDTSLGRDMPDEFKMIKRFRRSAAGYDEQLPSDIRTSLTLKLTLDHLLNNVIARSDRLAVVHKFVWDRTRAIRNDFSIQQVSQYDDVIRAVDCYERIARFHITSLHQLCNPDNLHEGENFDVFQEREQLNNTLLSLMYYYDDHRDAITFPHEAEFRAYCIIFEFQSQQPDLEDRVQAWPTHLLSDAQVQIALNLYNAASNTLFDQGPLRPMAPFSIAQSNITGFWTLLSSGAVPYTMACIAELYFSQLRFAALDALWRSGKKAPLPQQARTRDWTLDIVTEYLGFDTEGQTLDFCSAFDISFGQDEKGVQFLDLASHSDQQLHRSSIPNKQIFSQTLVEDKRCRRSLVAIINGVSVSDAISQRAMEAAEAEQSREGSEEIQQDDDEESLFIPETKQGISIGSSSDGLKSSASEPNPEATPFPFSNPFTKLPTIAASPTPPSDLSESQGPLRPTSPQPTPFPYSNPFSKIDPGTAASTAASTAPAPSEAPQKVADSNSFDPVNKSQTGTAEAMATSSAAETQPSLFQRFSEKPVATPSSKRFGEGLFNPVDPMASGTSAPPMSQEKVAGATGPPQPPFTWSLSQSPNGAALFTTVDERGDHPGTDKEFQAFASPAPSRLAPGIPSSGPSSNWQPRSGMDALASAQAISKAKVDHPGSTQVRATTQQPLSVPGADDKSAAQGNLKSGSTPWASKAPTTSETQQTVGNKAQVLDPSERWHPGQTAAQSITNVQSQENSQPPLFPSLFTANKNSPLGDFTSESSDKTADDNRRPRLQQQQSIDSALTAATTFVATSPAATSSSDPLANHLPPPSPPRPRFEPQVCATQAEAQKQKPVFSFAENSGQIAQQNQASDIPQVSRLANQAFGKTDRFRPPNMGAALSSLLEESKKLEKKAELIDTLTRMSLCQKDGLMDQLLQWSLPALLKDIIQQHQLEAWHNTMNHLKDNYLKRKFLSIWRTNAYRSASSKRARIRRQRLAEFMKAEKERHRKSEEDLREIYRAMEEKKQIQAEIQAREEAKEAEKEQLKPTVHLQQLAGQNRKSLTRRPREDIDDQEVRQSSQQHKRSRTIGSEFNLRSSLAQSTPANNKYRHSSVYSARPIFGPADGLRETQKRPYYPPLDRTRTDYFRLLAHGIDPNTPLVPLTATQVAEKERKEAEERKARAESDRRARRAQIKAGVLATSTDSSPPTEATQVALPDSSPTPSSAPVHSPDADPLIAEIRKLRQELINDTEWFKEQNEVMAKELEQEEKLRSSMGSSQSGRVSRNGLPTVNGYEYWPGPVLSDGSMSRVERRIRATGARGLANKPYGKYAAPEASKATSPSSDQPSDEVHPHQPSPGKKRGRRPAVDRSYRPTASDDDSEEDESTSKVKKRAKMAPKASPVKHPLSEYDNADLWGRGAIQRQWVSKASHLSNGPHVVRHKDYYPQNGRLEEADGFEEEELYEDEDDLGSDSEGNFIEDDEDELFEQDEDEFEDESEEEGPEDEEEHLDTGIQEKGLARAYMQTQSRATSDAPTPNTTSSGLGATAEDALVLSDSD